MALIMVYLTIDQSTNREFIEQAEKLMQWQGQFKAIFDKLEEPVIIISNKTAKYVNENFLTHFEKEIMVAESI